MIGIIVSQVVDMSQQVISATGMDAVDLLKAQARMPKGRVYGVEIIRDYSTGMTKPTLNIKAVTDGPWEVWKVEESRDHTDPLSQKNTYHVMWVARNVDIDIPNAERKYHQDMVTRVPEGALWPEEYGLWRTDV